MEFLPVSVSDCPNQQGNLIDYRPDSRLIILEGSLEWSNGADSEPCGVRFIEWTGKEFKRVVPSSIEKPQSRP
jgi:hypothetical protein